MTELHFECFAGISGDMALGALVDLGVDENELKMELSKLPVDGWKLEFRREERGGIYGVHPIVIMADGSTQHIAEGGDAGHQHEHHHHDSHEHHHENENAPRHAHEHRHEHRHWKEIKQMLETSALKEGAKKYAVKIFSVLAEAEAEVHGTSVEDVAFHEVGAVDSIIDIAGTAVCLDILKPDRITCSEVELGGGMVKCAHGVLPVPAPAVLKLCRGMPCKTGGFDKEMTTPTGAAILKAAAGEFKTQSSFVQIKEGIGIGTRRLEKPNFLRVSLRETAVSGNKPWLEEKLTLIECNIDDMTGEDFGFLQKCLFDAGALDVTFTPCTMKKNRPGIIVGVLSNEKKLDALRETLFMKSTTIGFRETVVNRLYLRREEEITQTEKGAVRVKKVFYGGDFLRQKIEYDDRIK